MFDVTLLGESRGELAARLDAADTFGRWASLVPELTAGGSVSTITGVFAALAPGTAADRWDSLLWSLLRLAAADGADQGDAVLAVLHAVAGGASRLVNRGFDEGLVLGELTIRIRTYPWRTRRRAVAANLLWDTEHALCCELSPAWMRTRGHMQRVTEIPVQITPGVLDEGADIDLPVEVNDDDLDLVDLLLWAERTGVVDARSLSMLVEYHYGRDATGAGHEHVARVFGVNARTSKRRCAATLGALRAAVPQYLAS
jgi:hypothetical protein